MDDGSLDALWAEVVGGSRAALAAVHAALAPSICAYAARLVGNDAVGEEVVQETFLTALRRAGQYRGPGRLRFWLFSIAHRAALDAMARERKHRRAPVAADAPAGGDDPVEVSERREVLRAAVAELPPAERTVLLMRMHLDLAFADIATMLGIPLNTALGRMHMALRRLRENGRLQRYFPDEMPAG